MVSQFVAGEARLPGFDQSLVAMYTPATHQLQELPAPFLLVTALPP